ncbi:cytochrome P450 [Mycena epipterygia]|nr:cytochrome P450 [Mycena epipterygia]
MTLILISLFYAPMSYPLLDILPLLERRWALVLGLSVVVFSHYIRKKRIPPLPPGPRGLPLLGNILDVPYEEQWRKFAEIGEVWGDLASLTIFGQALIIINSVKVAEDLLDVRGAIFSDRPVIPMGGELMGFNNALSLSQYGVRVRTERKIFHQLFGSQAAIRQFVPLVSSEICKLLQNILSNPDGVSEQIARTAGAITLRIAYAYHAVDGSGPDPYIKMFEKTGHNFAAATRPAAFLVDIIPALRYWPEWLPGGGFQRTAKIWGRQLHDTVDMGYNYVKDQMAAGIAETSFTSTVLEEQVHGEYLIKWAAASIQVGGADTTSSQLEGFLLAMSLHPDVQAAAQNEIDTVIGPDRLPDISDRSRLLYVDALCKEVFRWHVAVPTGIPHRAREDFIYTMDANSQPVLIPKDAVIITNIWKMTHDPARYANPMVFDPSRFIATGTKKAEQDPTKICFGYGRRICPGRLLADSTVFMACSAILAVFNISKARENGVIIEPRVGQSAGTISHPFPFKCSVEPRSARALELIRGS